MAPILEGGAAGGLLVATAAGLLDVGPAVHGVTSVPKDKIGALPAAELHTEVELHEPVTSEELREAVRKIRRDIAEGHCDFSDTTGKVLRAVGMDSETRPKFYKGGAPHPVDLVQIATRKRVVLFHFRHTWASASGAESTSSAGGSGSGVFGAASRHARPQGDTQKQERRFPAELLELLADRTVFKVGVGVTNDVQAIRTRAPGFDDNKSFMPLEGLLKAKFPQLTQIGLRGVTAALLGSSLSKSQQMSDWSRPLTNSQRAYAANDAVVSLRLLDVALGKRHHHHHHQQQQKLAGPAPQWVQPIAPAAPAVAVTAAADLSPEGVGALSARAAAGNERSETACTRNEDHSPLRAASPTPSSSPSRERAVQGEQPARVMPKAGSPARSPEVQRQLAVVLYCDMCLTKHPDKKPRVFLSQEALADHIRSFHGRDREPQQPQPQQHQQQQQKQQQQPQQQQQQQQQQRQQQPQRQQQQQQRQQPQQPQQQRQQQEQQRQLEAEPTRACFPESEAVGRKRDSSCREVGALCCPVCAAAPKPWPKAKFKVFASAEALMAHMSGKHSRAAAAVGAAAMAVEPPAKRQR
jgi:hypothetical protein